MANEELEKVVDDIEKVSVDDTKTEEELVAKTEERLAALGEDSTPEKLDDDPEKNKADDSEDTEDSTSDKDQTDDSEKTDDSTPGDSDDDSKKTQADDSKDDSKDKDKEESGDETPTLPDAYYRAAIHQKWKPEDITKFFEANPKLAKQTFENIYNSVNQSSKDFAAIGRAKQEQIKTDAETKEKPKESEFKEVDVEKLRKEYDNDPVVELVDQFQKQNKLLHDQVQELNNRTAQTNAGNNVTAAERVITQEQAAISQQVDQFFVSSDLKQYNDFYGEGKDIDILSPGQKANRWNVLNVADQMIMGAQAQGREISTGDAMNLAHLITTESLREKVIRKDIEKKVVKRSKGLSLSPSGGGKIAEKSKPSSADDLVARTEERLAKTFN